MARGYSERQSGANRRSVSITLRVSESLAAKIDAVRVDSRGYRRSRSEAARELLEDALAAQIDWAR